MIILLFNKNIKRNNLDPFNEYEDNQLWDSLKKCYLKKLVEELPGFFF